MALQFQDSTLQIFLSMYHGSLITTFIYDYIIRNSVRAAQHGATQFQISNIALGALCVIYIVWAVLSVWSKVRRNLVIGYIVLIVLLAARLAIGIPEFHDRSYANDMYEEDLIVYIVQLFVHSFGIVATFLLSRN